MFWSIDKLCACREQSTGGSQHGSQRLKDGKRWVAQMR